MEPFASGGVYVNYLGAERDEGAERVRAAYDPQKYERLVRLKRKYDPENRFRMNQNIPPCMAPDVESDHFRRMRWLSPNSCHRYPVAIAARYPCKPFGSP